MLQQTFAEVTFEQYRKPTRRERCLNEMNHVVLWWHWGRRASRSTPRPRARGVHPWELRACSAFISSNSGSPCPTPP